MLSFLLFSSVAMAQSPQLTTVSPVMITAYGPASTLKVLGSQFTKTCVVYWNWSPRATTYVSPTELKAEILASDIATPTTGYVTVEDMVTVTMTTGVEVPVTGGVPKLLFTKMYAPWNDTPGEIGSPGFLVNLASTPGGYMGAAAGIVLWASYGNASFDGGEPFGRPAGYIIGEADLANAGSPGLIAPQRFIRDGGTPQNMFPPASGVGPSLEPPMVIGDIDRNGTLDVIDYAQSSTPSETTLNLWLGDGDGHFPDPAIEFVPFPNEVIKGLMLGDFNGDGKLDLAAVLWDYDDPPKTQGLGIALGNGDGTFKAPILLPAPEGTTAAQVADVNGDGILDLVSLDSSTATIQVWLGKGDGTFTLHGSYPTGLYGPSQFALAPMFGSHRQDLVLTGTLAADGKYPRLEFMPGNPDGSFGSPVRMVVPSAASYPIVGDFNDDGRLDVVGVGPGWLYVQDPLVWVSPLSIDFGSQFLGSPVTKPVTVTNTGAVAVPISGVTITGSGASAFTQTNNCVGSRAARGATCTVQVTFAPAADAAFTATLTVEHAVEGVNTVALSGTGI